MKGKSANAFPERQRASQPASARERESESITNNRWRESLLQTILHNGGSCGRGTGEGEGRMERVRERERERVRVRVREREGGRVD